jgi:predicted signal transduction protein with EAL and GGDEF domain
VSHPLIFRAGIEPGTVLPFGTGLSSLSYLRSFPFVAGLADGNEESLAIVRAVARLGASLGVATTSEGVETQLQLEIARREGFTEAQGFWIGKPKSGAAIAEAGDILRTRKTKRRPEAAEPEPTKSVAIAVERAAEPTIEAVDGAPKRSSARAGPARLRRQAQWGALIAQSKS